MPGRFARSTQPRPYRRNSLTAIASVLPGYTPYEWNLRVDVWDCFEWELHRRILLQLQSDPLRIEPMVIKIPPIPYGAVDRRMLPGVGTLIFSRFYSRFSRFWVPTNHSLFIDFYRNRFLKNTMWICLSQKKHIQ